MAKPGPGGSGGGCGSPREVLVNMLVSSTVRILLSTSGRFTKYFRHHRLLDAAGLAKVGAEVALAGSVSYTTLIVKRTEKKNPTTKKNRKRTNKKAHSIMRMN